jgi:hypothetical protein
MSNPRVLRMNELSSTRYDDVPLPVRQQLGEFNDKVDVDARSGNGIRDYDLRKEAAGKDYDELDPERNGHQVLAVTYHLDSTDAPAEPVGAPGTESYRRANRAQDRVTPDAEGQEGVSLSTQGNATLAVQSGREHYVSTQREIPGRNERYAKAVGSSDPTGASVGAGEGGAAYVLPSQSIQDSGDDVPSGNIATVLNWVGDDKDKAQKAREAESQKDNPRSSLIERLDNIIEDDKDK